MTFSRNWLEQSDEAKARGICHTEEECKLMYAEIEPAIKGRAIRHLVAKLDWDYGMREISVAITQGGEHWNAPYHLGLGMAIRNELRGAGFREQDFGIDNLDCIYKFLVEDAVLYWQAQQGGGTVFQLPEKDRDTQCHARAKQRGQRTFTLVEQDRTAVETICDWITRNVRTAPPEKLIEALETAIAMREYPTQKAAD